MSKRTGPTNPVLKELLRRLRSEGKKQKAKIWLELADRIEGPRRRRSEVNLSQINRVAGDGETVVVPGKVLAAGRLRHPVNIAAIKFSRSAAKKVVESGGKVLTIQQLMEVNPKGNGVRLIR